jgi:hypothetical protein
MENSRILEWKERLNLSPNNAQKLIFVYSRSQSHFTLNFETLKFGAPEIKTHKQHVR